MEHLLSDLNNSGQSLDTAQSLRLNRRPTVASTTMNSKDKGRAFADLGSTFGSKFKPALGGTTATTATRRSAAPSGSQKSQGRGRDRTPERSTGMSASRMKPRSKSQHMSPKPHYSSSPSPDEMDLLSDPAQDGDDDRWSSQTGAPLRISDKGHPYAGLKFKKKSHLENPSTSQGDDTSKVNEASSTVPTTSSHISIDLDDDDEIEITGQNPRPLGSRNANRKLSPPASSSLPIPRARSSTNVPGTTYKPKPRPIPGAPISTSLPPSSFLSSPQPSSSQTRPSGSLVIPLAMQPVGSQEKGKPKPRPIVALKGKETAKSKEPQAFPMDFGSDSMQVDLDEGDIHAFKPKHKSKTKLASAVEKPTTVVADFPLSPPTSGKPKEGDSAKAKKRDVQEFPCMSPSAGSRTKSSASSKSEDEVVAVRRTKRVASTRHATDLVDDDDDEGDAEEEDEGEGSGFEDKPRSLRSKASKANLKSSKSKPSKEKDEGQDKKTETEKKKRKKPARKIAEFPMSTQMLDGLSDPLFRDYPPGASRVADDGNSWSPSSSLGKRNSGSSDVDTDDPDGESRSGGGGNDKGRKVKKRREYDAFMESPTRRFLDEEGDSLCLDVNIDPKGLCPYCDTPLPSTSSSVLLNLLASLRSKSRKDPRPSNPLGLKAPLAVFISVCQRHRFESQILPTAEKKGWPKSIDWEDVKYRVEGMKAFLGELVGGRDETSVFWKEILKEVEEKGSRAVSGVRGQFANFEKTQPGYYGELGSVIIHQTLFNMFPPSDIDPDVISPLTVNEFMHRVLVPEVAARLIMQDKDLHGGQGMKEAMDILRDSSSYGVAMFPEDGGEWGARLGKGKAKNQKGGHLDDDDDGDVETWGDEGHMGVGDKIVMERARRRRKELEEEEEKERLEEEALKRKWKPPLRGRGYRRSQDVETEAEVDVGQPPTTTRPRPRPVVKGGSAMNLFSDNEPPMSSQPPPPSRSTAKSRSRSRSVAPSPQPRPRSVLRDENKGRATTRSRSRAPLSDKNDEEIQIITRGIKSRPKRGVETTDSAGSAIEITDGSGNEEGLNSLQGRSRIKPPKAKIKRFIRSPSASEFDSKNEAEADWQFSQLPRPSGSKARLEMRKEKQVDSDDMVLSDSSTQAVVNTARSGQLRAKASAQPFPMDLEMDLGSKALADTTTTPRTRSRSKSIIQVKDKYAMDVDVDFVDDKTPMPTKRTFWDPPANQGGKADETPKANRPKPAPKPGMSFSRIGPADGPPTQAKENADLEDKPLMRARARRAEMQCAASGSTSAAVARAMSSTRLKVNSKSATTVGGWSKSMLSNPDTMEDEKVSFGRVSGSTTKATSKSGSKSGLEKQGSFSWLLSDSSQPQTQTLG